MDFTAKIRGLPHNPAITEINARSGPSTSYDRPFKARVGLGGLPVLDVQPDQEGTEFQGKIYQWFQLEFPDGQRAWVRDDLLAVTGDGLRFGYDVVNEETFAFVLPRRDVIAPGQEITRPHPTAARTRADARDTQRGNACPANPGHSRARCPAGDKRQRSPAG